MIYGSVVADRSLTSDDTSTAARQAPNGQGTTSPPHPSAGERVVCAVCRHENPAGTDLCEGVTAAGRRCRKTLKGNRIAVRAGIYATPSIDDELGARALFEQSVLDSGGREELTARELTQHEYRAIVHTNIRKLASALERHGHFDRRGRLRVSWISKLESLTSVALSIDKTLGFTRRARRVPTLQEWAAEHRQEATK
jgi:hypothetical protein